MNNTVLDVSFGRTPSKILAKVKEIASKIGNVTDPVVGNLHQSYNAQDRM